MYIVLSVMVMILEINGEELKDFFYVIDYVNETDYYLMFILQNLFQYLRMEYFSELLSLDFIIIIFETDQFYN